MNEDPGIFLLVSTIAALAAALISSIIPLLIDGYFRRRKPSPGSLDAGSVQTSRVAHSTSRFRRGLAILRDAFLIQGVAFWMGFVAGVALSSAVALVNPNLNSNQINTVAQNLLPITTIVANFIITLVWFPIAFILSAIFVPNNRWRHNFFVALVVASVDILVNLAQPQQVIGDISGWWISRIIVVLVVMLIGTAISYLFKRKARNTQTVQSPSQPPIPLPLHESNTTESKVAVENTASPLPFYESIPTEREVAVKQTSTPLPFPETAVTERKVAIEDTPII